MENLVLKLGEPCLINKTPLRENSREKIFVIESWGENEGIWGGLG